MQLQAGGSIEKTAATIAEEGKGLFVLLGHLKRA